MKTILKLVPALLITLFISSCGMKGSGIPEDKKDYIGYWSGENMSIDISSTGSVSYKRQKDGGATTSVNGPIQKFEGDNFIVGALGFNTTFSVTATPHDDGGVMKMTVDGVELVRSN